MPDLIDTEGRMPWEDGYVVPTAPATAATVERPVAAPAAAPPAAQHTVGVITMTTAAGHPLRPSPILDEYDAIDAALEGDDEYTSGELAQSDLELRAEVDSLESLLHMRRGVIREIAPLDGLFGGGQNTLADARRKQHRHLVQSAIVEELRRAATEAGGDKPFKEPAETALERMANSDPRHVAFVDALEAQRVQYTRLRAALTEIDERIRSRSFALNIYAVNRKLEAAGA